MRGGKGSGKVPAAPQPHKAFPVQHLEGLKVCEPDHWLQGGPVLYCRSLSLHLRTRSSPGFPDSEQAGASAGMDLGGRIFLLFILLSQAQSG